MSYDDIFGYCDFYDIYSDFLDGATDGFVFVEVGTFMGRSVAYMAEQATSRGMSGQIWCVDNWRVTDSPRPSFNDWGPPQYANALMQACGAFNYFTSTMSKMAPGALERIRVVRADSLQASKMFDVQSVDMAFIDADHSYDGVMADIAAWLPKVKSGGVLAGHDYLYFDDVKRAVEESFGDGGFAVRGSSWVHHVK